MQSRSVISIDLDHAVTALDGEHLEDLIDLFLAEQSRRNTDVTVTGYRAKLAPFVAWWRQAGPSMRWQLSADDLAEFAEGLHQHGYSYHTRNDVLRRLRQVFRWGHQRGYVPVDFSLDVPKAKGHPMPRKAATMDDLLALMRAAGRLAFTLRNRALLAAFAGTGMRLMECEALRIENVEFKPGLSGYALLERTKGDKPRYVAFDGHTGNHLWRQIDEVGLESGPVFRSRLGGALTSSGIYKAIREIVALAEVGERVKGPHDLRRMFATRWNRHLRGESYGQLLQMQLGHASWDTTRIYSLQDVDDVLEVMCQESVSPLAELARIG